MITMSTFEVFTGKPGGTLMGKEAIFKTTVIFFIEGWYQ